MSLFIFPTGPTALDSEPSGRRYVKKWDTTGTVFIQGPSIVLPVWRCIMFYDSYLRACMKLRIVQKIRFSLLESRRTKPWCPGLVSRPSVLYFEHSFLGCGFLIHLSNRSDSPRFRALWKKIHQKYGTQQEPSLFKGHPLSC